MVKRLLVFGWDGVPKTVINNAIEMGYIENFKSLMDNGAYGSVKAVLPLVTPANWYSAFTGYRTEKHGVTNFVVVDKDYRLKYMSASDLKVPGLWNYLESKDMKGIYVNIPASTPAPKVNGIWISHEEVLKEPSEYHVYPNEILDKIRRWGFKVGYPFPIDYPRKFSRELLEIEDKKIDTFYRLLKEYEWNLSICVVQSPDILLHAFMDVPGYMEEVYKSLQLLDNWLGRLVNEFSGDTYFLIFSDHGNKRKKGYINLVSILRKKGLLNTREYKKLRAGWIRRNRFIRYIWSKLSPGLREKISRNVLDKFLRLDSPERMITTLVDWEKTKVFPNVNVGGLKINLKNLFVKGIVSKEDKEKIIEMVVKSLSNLEINGLKLFNEVSPVYTDDPYIPDIFLEPNDDLWFISQNSEEDLIPAKKWEIRDDVKLDANQSTASHHIREGFYLLSGENIRKGGGPTINMPDITPTILYILDLPIPKSLDGKLQPRLFDDNFFKNNPPRYTSYRKSMIKSQAKRIRRKLNKK